MTILQLIATVATLAVQAVVVGLLFAWRIKNDPTMSSHSPEPERSDNIGRALLWLAVVCIGGGLVTTGCLAYGAFTEAV